MNDAPSTAPAVYSIPATLPFVDALAAGLMDRAGGDPAQLSRMTVLLPTRRACRSLAEAFLRQSGGQAMLLPKMTPLGDLDEEELSLSGWSDSGSESDLSVGGFDVPPAISGLRRQLLLSRLILALDPDGTSPDQAVRLAAELARLLDQVHTERLGFEALAGLVPEDFAHHWQKTLDFLKILTEHWPAILAGEGCLDVAQRRNLLLEGQARLWQAKPPADPVIAAGSTGSIPATADLLQVVAGLPQGALVLPGLDIQADAETWAALEPAHPQYGMARLLGHLEVAPEDVREWPAPGLEATAPGRAALINRALCPASLSGNNLFSGDPTHTAAALKGVSRIDCPGPQEEAGVIALVMRQTLEDPGRTAALVTPDRVLARRVAAELGRWGLRVDDSAGQPLSQSPPGAFLRQTARLAVDKLAPVPLLATLKHPLAAGGQAAGRFRAQVRDLERAVLRGPRPAPGIDGLRAALPDKHQTALTPLLDVLQAALSPLAGLLADGKASLGPLLKAHVEMAETLAATDQADGASRLWAGEAGEALAAFIAELNESAATLDAITASAYPALLDSLMAGRVVRPRYGQHPRLNIWGLLEARLQRADVLILGGLNEDTWPPEAHANPWMSRPMLHAFGLPLPERRIGLTAHDFTQAFSAPRVVITRSQRVDGTPTVPSRWLLRLDNLLQASGGEDMLAAESRWLHWQQQLDEPETVKPVAPPAPRPPVAARPRRLSVSRIETWIRDPYAIYARTILGLDVLDPIDADPGAAERGTIVHEALEAFIRQHQADLPEDAADAMIDIGRDVFGTSLSSPGVRAFWWPRFKRIAHWFTDFERARRAGGAEILALETPGELTVSGPAGDFKLTARADRIDRLAQRGLAILDYKTGQPPTAKQVISGLTPQLSLEAAILRDGGFKGVTAEAAGALTYVRLSGGRQPGEEKVLDLDVAEVTDTALAGLIKRIKAFDDPKTPYLSRPVPMFESRFGDYDHLARVKEWMAAEGGGE